MVYSPKEYDIFIGIDVDQKSFSFTVKNHDTMSNSYKIPSSPENLYQHIRNRYNSKRVTCAYEVGVTGYYLRAKHHPQIGSRKAIVAVVRKLTLIIYRVLKEQREYIANM